jgi:hypothetical protein
MQQVFRKPSDPKPPTTDFSAFFLFCDCVSKNKEIFKHDCLVLQTLSNGNLKQHGLFNNTPKCDTPFHGAGVSGSTVM